MPPREWRLRVEDILEAIARIEQYADGLSVEQFRADQKTVDAVVRNLEVIGEAVRHLAADHEGLPTGIPWSDIAGMRNILIHEYFGVDLNIIWQPSRTTSRNYAVSFSGLSGRPGRGRRLTGTS